jgi:tetratricopeptide (TPR) repeat protein
MSEADQPGLPQALLALMDTLERLSMGQPIDVPAWRRVLVLADRATGPEFSAPRILARIATASTSTECRETAKTLDGMHEPRMAIIGRAFQAQRRIELGDDGPGVVAERAHALLSLASLHRGGNLGQRFLLRAVADFGSAVETSLAAGDRANAFAHAIAYAAAVNSARGEEAIRSRLGGIFALLFELLTDEEGKGSLRAALAVNLITTCSRLVEIEIAQQAVWMMKIIELGEIALGLVERGETGDLPAPMLRQVLLSAFSAILRARIALAANEPDHFEEHARHARKSVERGRAIADGSDDAELRTLLASMFAAALEQINDAGGHIDPAEREGDSGFNAAVQADLAALHAQAARIVETSEGEVRRRLIEEAAAPLFAEIDAILSVQIAHVGMNHRVCRFIAAVGAIAGGRLGSLNRSIVMSWATTITAPTGSASERQFQRRQQMMAPVAESAVLSLGAAIANLAAFADQLADDPHAREDARVVFRSLFRQLIRGLLERPDLAMPIDREVTTDDDVRVVISSLPEAVQLDLADAYLGKPAEDRDRLPLAPPRRKRVSTPPKPRNAEAESDEPNPPAPDYSTDVEYLRILGDRLTGRPEDLVGTTIETPGGHYTVMALAGRGESKVVFQVKHEESGRVVAAAIFVQAALDRWRQAVDEANHPNFDADKVLDGCTRILALTPDDEVAHYNKGIALLTKHDYARAASSFESAIQANPRDVLNWFYLGHSYAEAGQFDEAVEAIVIAAGIDVNRVVQLFRDLNARPFHTAVQQVLELDPNDQEALAIQIMLRKAALPD